MSGIPDKETIAAATGAVATLLFVWGKLRDFFPDSRAARVERKLDRVLERQDAIDERMRTVEVDVGTIKGRMQGE